MIKYKYITEIDRKTFDESVVIPCINEEGFRTIIIKNSTKKSVQTLYSTKVLSIKKNAFLTSDNYEYYCHIISCKDSSEYTNRNFDIIYEYLFKKIEYPIDEFIFSDIVLSLEELFTKVYGDIKTIQIGVIGELLVLLQLFNNGKNDIFNNYHKNLYSRHDIEITSKIKIEVKTSSSEKRIHRFSHKQISNDEYIVYIASVLLEISEKGTTLYELVNLCINHSNNYETKFSLNKIMNYCQIDAFNQGLSFDLRSTIDRIKYYCVTEIPRIVENLPVGISNLSYDVMLDTVNDISVQELLKRIL